MGEYRDGIRGHSCHPVRVALGMKKVGWPAEIESGVESVTEME